MVCNSITVQGTTLKLKAIEFGKFWADNLTDGQLKTFAKAGLVTFGNPGDEILTSEPVHRENGLAYVVFTPSTTQYIEFNILTGMKAILGAAFGWVKANPGKATALFLAFAYVNIRIIDWLTKIEEAKTNISHDETIGDILDNPTLTNDQKFDLIMKYLGVLTKGTTDWGTTVLYAAGILGAAYVISSMFGGRR